MRERGEQGENGAQYRVSIDYPRAVSHLWAPQLGFFMLE